MWRPKARPDPELLRLFEQSGQNVRRTTGLMRELLASYPEQPELASEIIECEHQGDQIVHDIMHRLAERGARRAHIESADVHALAGALDDVVDHTEEAAGQLNLYGIEAPMDAAQEIADVLVQASERVATSLGLLRNGADLGPHLVEIHRLENEADAIVRGAVASLFVTGIDPMIVIRWKDIFETLERAVDACETVANVLEGIVLKRHGA
jgi:predicted phosphate transport protein (TIGR00153 family)